IARDTVQTLLAECRASGGIAVEDRVAALVRRFDARRALASGELQRFSVESVNAAEALALLTSLERPEHAPAIDALVTELRASINTARNAPAQIVAAERSSALLWSVRMGNTP